MFLPCFISPTAISVKPLRCFLCLHVLAVSGNHKYNQKTVQYYPDSGLFQVHYKLLRHFKQAFF